MQRTGKKTLATEARHRISIQSYTAVADGEGGFTNTWTTTATVWAAVYPVKASQVFDYYSVNSEITHIIKLRGYITVNATQRVLFGTRIFEILTAENLQERDFVQVLSCKERVVAGDDDQTTTTAAP